MVGLWRREGFLQQELTSIRLKAGDVLVLPGDEESLTRVSQDRAFLMMVPFHGELQLRRKASLAAGVMLATIVAAAINIIRLDIVMLAGAVAIVLSGCITARQAYRAIDARIYVFIAGAIPLGARHAEKRHCQSSGTLAAECHGRVEYAVHPADDFRYCGRGDANYVGCRDNRALRAGCRRTGAGYGPHA